MLLANRVFPSQIGEESHATLLVRHGPREPSIPRDDRIVDGTLGYIIPSQPGEGPYETLLAGQGLNEASIIAKKVCDQGCGSR